MWCKSCYENNTAERIAHYDPATVISGDEMNRRLGITEEYLSGYDEVEIE